MISNGTVAILASEVCFVDTLSARKKEASFSMIN